MRTLTLYEAADLLQVHWQTLRAKAAAGEVPSAKLGQKWVFLEEDLVSWLRSQYAQPWPRSQAQRETGVTSCCSSDQTRATGGAISPHQTEAEYNDLLGR